jgi:hypothetical protein
MQRYPIAYLRRSGAYNGDPGDVSRDVHEAAVLELARRDGYNGDTKVLDGDLGRSADLRKENRRGDFLQMLAAIERGEVSAASAAALDLGLQPCARSGGVAGD